MAEWLKAHAWKACVAAMSPQVRILFSPQGETRPIQFWIGLFLLMKKRIRARFGVAKRRRRSRYPVLSAKIFRHQFWVSKYFVCDSGPEAAGDVKIVATAGSA